MTATAQSKLSISSGTSSHGTLPKQRKVRFEVEGAAFRSDHLSSGAERADSLANHSAKSRDPVPAGNQHWPEKEFSAQLSGAKVGDKNASTRSLQNEQT